MRHYHHLAWFAVLLGLQVLALGLSWWLHAEFNYGYVIWYEWLDLRGHIAEFGPQNRYIAGFETLSAQAQIAAFNAIVQAVHGDAGPSTLEALRHIHFTDAYGTTKALLREPEVIHLHDVSVLMAQIRNALMVIAVLTAVGLYALRERVTAIRWRWQGLLLLILIISLALLVALAGFESVFYQLHRWVFPDGHEWFFFYQDSLMSTMMKAPDLFAGIGASLVALGVVFFAAMLWILHALSRRVMQATPQKAVRR